MSRSFASFIRTRWNVSNYKRLWNRAFRHKEKHNILKTNFTITGAFEWCPGCEICDKMPDYGNQHSYLSISKYSVSGRHGKKLYYGGQRKICSYRKTFDTPLTYLDAVKMSSK